MNESPYHWLFELQAIRQPHIKGSYEAHLAERFNSLFYLFIYLFYVELSKLRVIRAVQL